eukprot:gene4018-14498_t
MFFCLEVINQHSALIDHLQTEEQLEFRLNLMILQGTDTLSDLPQSFVDSVIVILPDSANVVVDLQISHRGMIANR